MLHLRGKIIYVPVNLKGVDNKWCFESVTSVRMFLKDVKASAFMSIIFNLVVILLMAGIIIYLLINRITKPLAIIEKLMDKLARYNLNVEEEIKEKTESAVTTMDEIGKIVVEQNKKTSDTKEKLKEIAD